MLDIALMSELHIQVNYRVLQLPVGGGKLSAQPLANISRHAHVSPSHLGASSVTVVLWGSKPHGIRTRVIEINSRKYTGCEWKWK